MPNLEFALVLALLLMLAFVTAPPSVLLSGACKPRPRPAGRSLFSRIMLLAFPYRRPGYVGPLVGTFVTFDNEPGVERMLESLTEQLSGATAEWSKVKTEMDTQYRELTAHFGSVKNDNGELAAKVKEQTAVYGELAAKYQGLEAKIDIIRRDLAAPIIQGGSTLADADRKAAIELQRARHIFNGGDVFDFVVDEKKLVDAKDYRSAVHKLSAAGYLDRATIIRSFTEREKIAFDSSGLDASFFAPQMLGLTVDCNVLCSTMFDLYDTQRVSRSTFMYSKVVDYAAIGSYDCSAACEAELGPPNNITWSNGRTYDFRGAFCFNRDTVREANFDLMGFMVQAAQRSYILNRNRALISGDGKNEPLGWAKADCFAKRKTAGQAFTHQDFRAFVASCPVEYGPVVTTMHQNTFAYLASLVDADRRFLFGDGLLTFSPDDVRDRIRISNCLPDPTEDLTLGNTASPLATGSYLCTAGNWKTAYSMVDRQPMYFEQVIGKSTSLCATYQFAASDGGFVACCAAARTLVVG